MGDMATINEQYFENVLFKKLIKDPNFMGASVGKLDSRIFSVSSYEKVGKFYQDFWVRHERLPNKEDLKIYIRNEDTAFTTELQESLSRCSSVDLDKIDDQEFFDNAERFIKKRAALLALQEIVSKYTNGAINPDEAVKKFEEVAAIKLTKTLGYDIYKDIDRYMKNLEDEGGRLPLGWRDIDEVCNGGIPANGKFLGVVSAPTNMGKSIFLGNVAVNAVRQNKKVLLISLEMSEMVYATRIYSALYGFNIAEISVKRNELKERVLNSQMGGMIISEFPPGSMTVDQIEGHINDLKKQGHKFDLVCVDYLTLLAAPGADNSNEAGKIISRKLRALSYKFGCPFFTAAQINRDGFGIAPDMKYMAESIAICSEADLILSLYRNEEDVEMSIMRVWFLKSRLGIKDCSVRLYFNTKSLRFEDMEDSTVTTGNTTADTIVTDVISTTDNADLSNSISDILGMT